MHIRALLSRSSLLLAGFVLTGCATSVDMSDLRARVDNDEARIHKLQSQLGSSGGDQLNSQIADMEARLDRQKARLESLRGRLDTIDHRIDQLRGQIASAPPPQTAAPLSGATPVPMTPSATVPQAGSPSENAKSIYSQAMRDYQSGHFSLSQKEFSEVISRYPSSYLAGSAQFWVGQSLFYAKKYKDAIDAYNQLIQKYPESGKKADAFYKRAMAYELLGNKSQAIHYYRRILDVFPGETDLDEKAKRRIKRLE